MGKGSKPRPLSVSQQKFDENFEKIFGKKEKETTITISVLGNTAHGSTAKAEWVLGEPKPDDWEG